MRIRRRLQMGMAGLLGGPFLRGCGAIRPEQVMAQLELGEHMKQTGFLIDVPGAAEIINWFGHWPTFHDAEVVSIELNRSGTSILKVHTFVGHKHAIVSFLLDDICELQLSGFNHQNVIFRLDLNKQDEEYEIVLVGCYGVEGRIVTKKIQITFEAGIPASSVYA